MRYESPPSRCFCLRIIRENSEIRESVALSGLATGQVYISA